MFEIKQIKIHRLNFCVSFGLCVKGENNFKIKYRCLYDSLQLALQAYSTWAGMHSVFKTLGLYMMGWS